MEIGQRVWVSEYGSPPLRGTVVREYFAVSDPTMTQYSDPRPDGSTYHRRIIVQLDDTSRPCPVDRFASSVFTDRKEAELAAQ